MANETLAAMTAATADTGGLLYGTQSGANRKFTTTAAGATLMEAADVAAQVTALGVLSLAGGTLLGALINSTNGAVSAPVLSLTGTTYTGGSATTTKPTFLIEPTGTTSSGWSTAGTLVGANAATGFTGNLLDLQLAGTSKFKVSSTGALTAGGDMTVNGSLVGYSNTVFLGGYGLTIASTVQLAFASSSNSQGACDAFIRRNGTASVQLGIDDAGVTNQRLQGCNRITSNGAGANLTLAGGNCRGTTGEGGVGGSLILSTYAASGTTNTVGTLTTRVTIDTKGVALISNADAAPSATPSGGGYLYTEGGALKFKGSSGTVTTLAVA